MKIINKTAEKRTYSTPQIERIQLDNEISLVLQSDTNPNGEPEFSQSPEYFNIDPFDTNVG